MLPDKLNEILENRKSNNALRKLGVQNDLVDFSSNDYLGFSKSERLFEKAYDFLKGHNIIQIGATGSRLLSGNYPLFQVIESMLSNFHNCESALIYNSGYDANMGFFSSVPQRGDVILYDEYVHASIREGIRLSNANSYKFRHNDMKVLEGLIFRYSDAVSDSHSNIYVVTESVFSMDGDSPNLLELTKICSSENIHLVVDEAHATGVFGKQGKGLIQAHRLEEKVFARIITFGKALGCHGAAILGNSNLIEFLINFSKSFIYTTALPPHSLACIHSAYNELVITSNLQKLMHNITYFKNQVSKNKLNANFIPSDSAIHSCVISGNNKVKMVAKELMENGFDVKPILSPTVPEGRERLRFCLHSFNTENEISDVLNLLATFVFKTNTVYE